MGAISEAERNDSIRHQAGPFAIELQRMKVHDPGLKLTAGMKPGRTQRALRELRRQTEEHHVGFERGARRHERGTSPGNGSGREFGSTPRIDPVAEDLSDRELLDLHRELLRAELRPMKGDRSYAQRASGADAASTRIDLQRVERGEPVAGVRIEERSREIDIGDPQMVTVDRCMERSLEEPAMTEPAVRSSRDPRDTSRVERKQHGRRDLHPNQALVQIDRGRKIDIERQRLDVRHSLEASAELDVRTGCVQSAA
jgi:hypothetical protein